MRLDLWNAEARADLDVAGQAWRLRCFAHAERDVIVLHLTGQGAEPAFSWHADVARSTRTFRKPEGLHVEPYPPQERRDRGGVSVSVQPMPDDERYHTDGQGAGEYATAWLRQPTGDGVVFYISTKYTCPGTTAAEEAERLVRRASEAGLAVLNDSHRAWWHAFYPKSMVSVPDGEVESFYWIQMYKMGSASRGGGPICDLMGPWFTETQWPAIWWNLNIQLTYWPFYMANHLDEAEPLIETLWGQRANLAANADNASGEAYAIGRAAGPDCRSDVGTEIGNLPWVMHNLWLHYRSTMDDGLLRERIFPLMKGSYRYLRGLLVDRPDGALALPASASPEYIDAVESCSYTLACLRWLAATLLVADARLEAGDPVVEDCSDLLARLEPYPVDPGTGFMVGKDTPFAESHRHWSHLFMIYPFAEYTWGRAEHVELLERSLENWTSRGEAFAGYSWLGAASMHAMAGRGDVALEFLREFLARSPLPNTMYREGSPVIETPLAFARTVQEMLMTSHGGVIRIFPGVPEAWPDVAFADLRAEGAFLVSARRECGRTRCIRVVSLTGEPLRIQTGLSGSVRADVDIELQHDATTGITACSLLAGQSLLLFTGDNVPEADFAPVEPRSACPAWGGRHDATT